MDRERFFMDREKVINVTLAAGQLGPSSAWFSNEIRGMRRAESLSRWDYAARGVREGPGRKPHAGTRVNSVPRSGSGPTRQQPAIDSVLPVRSGGREFLDRDASATHAQRDSP